MQTAAPFATAPRAPWERVDASPVVAYTLDTDDRIMRVNAAWAEFAAANGGPRAEAVVGTSLWSHVSDPTTRHLYHLLCQRARAGGRTVRVAYRCDSPGVVREMELAITRAPAGALHVESRTLRARARAPLAALDPLLHRTGALLRLCSWCKRVDVRGEWMELEEAAATRALFARAATPPITHGICPDCERAVLATLDAEEDAAGRWAR